jgi:hypothetical protein
MNTLGEAKQQKPRAGADAIDLKDLTYYVHLIDGQVQEVAPVTEMRLTKAEVIFILDEVEARRLPRQAVYFATRQPGPPPVLD